MHSETNASLPVYMKMEVFRRLRVIDEPRLSYRGL